MPRAPKKCGHLTCEERVVARTYCDTHQAMHRVRDTARRGTSRQRGYDTQHDAEARRAKALAVALGLPCPRCGMPMLAGQPLDYGHTMARATDPSSRADRVEHSHCNRSAKDRDV